MQRTLTIALTVLPILLSGGAAACVMGSVYNLPIPCREFRHDVLLDHLWPGGYLCHRVDGDIYAMMNPWRTLCDWIEQFDRGTFGGWLRYPEWLGYYPALALYMAFIWIELFGWIQPRTLAAILLILYGPEPERRVAGREGNLVPLRRVLLGVFPAHRHDAALGGHLLEGYPSDNLRRRRSHDLRPVQSWLEPLRHRQIDWQSDRPGRRYGLALAGRAHSVRSHCQRLPRACGSAESIPESTTCRAEPIADAGTNGAGDHHRLVDPVASRRRSDDGSGACLEHRVWIRIAACRDQRGADTSWFRWSLTSTDRESPPKRVVVPSRLWAER